MTLITTNGQIKEANSSVVYDLNFDSIKSFVEDASLRYMQPAIGASTYDRLGNDVSERVTYAAGLARKAEANFAIALFTNFGSVKLGENGAMVYQSDTVKIASDKKVASLINQAMSDGYAVIELLVAFLESNKAIFTEYAQSQARKNNRKRYINSTEEFNSVLFINNNATLFNSLKTFLTDAEEEHIEPLLGDDFNEALRAKVLDNNLSDLEAELVRLIGKVVAPYAIAMAIPYRAVNVDVDGLYTNTPIFSTGSGSSQGLDSNRIAMGMTAALKQGEKNIVRLRKFINRNQTLLAGANQINLDSKAIPRQVDGGILFL